MTGSRRQARERALELLYEAESKQEAPGDLIAALPLAPDKFASELVTGVAEHLSEIDALLGRFSRGWRLDRMPMIDRLLLRIATFELTLEGDQVTVVDEGHYKLVPGDQISADDLSAYRRRR